MKENQQKAVDHNIETDHSCGNWVGASYAWCEIMSPLIVFTRWCQLMDQFIDQGVIYSNSAFKS